MYLFLRSTGVAATHKFDLISQNAYFDTIMLGKGINDKQNEEKDISNSPYSLHKEEVFQHQMQPRLKTFWDELQAELGVKCG